MEPADPSLAPGYCVPATPIIRILSHRPEAVYVVRRLTTEGQWGENGELVPSIP